VALIQDRENRLFYKPALIVGGGDNADFRKHASQRFCSYHSTVRRSPSSRGVLARKPNLSKARVTSSRRRGWPSGLPACHLTSPLKPATRQINATRSLIAISWPIPIFTGSSSL